MPVYEYSCQDEKCNHKWEELQSMIDPVIIVCPLCKEETAKKLISHVSFVLKGGGWADTGYSSK